MMDVRLLGQLALGQAGGAAGVAEEEGEVSHERPSRAEGPPRPLVRAHQCEAAGDEGTACHLFLKIAAQVIVGGQ